MQVLNCQYQKSLNVVSIQSHLCIKHKEQSWTTVPCVTKINKAHRGEILYYYMVAGELDYQEKQLVETVI